MKATPHICHMNDGKDIKCKCLRGSDHYEAQTDIPTLMDEPDYGRSDEPIEGFSPLEPPE